MSTITRSVARTAATLVLASASAIGVAAIPAHATPITPLPVAQDGKALRTSDYIGYVGVGSYTLGLSSTVLRQPKLIEPGVCEGSWRPVKQARDFAGASTFFNADDKLTQVWVTKPTLKTWSGAKVGMTMAQVKKIYGSKFHYVTVTKAWGGKKVLVGQVRSGGREVIFVAGTSGYDATSAKATSKVGAIVARDVSRYLPVTEC